jgi:ABC-2 type transport system ATP-binding protein
MVVYMRIFKDLMVCERSRSASTPNVPDRVRPFVTNAIDVDALRKVHGEGSSSAVVALDGLSFSVPEGSIFGLLGTNGAGKSTTVKILATCARPTSGSVRVFGIDVVEEPLESRRRMAVVLQNSASESLLNVEDNLLIYAYLHGLSKRDAATRAARVIDEFELGDLRAKAAQELSQGTRRRIQVAKIFMLDAPLIVMDEATTGMDPLMKRRLMDRLRAEARAGRTILLTTQVLSEAEELCESFMILDKGRAMASGSLQDLRNRSAQTFRVSLSFGDTDADLRRLLQPLDPIDLRISGRTAEMLIRSGESELLEKLTGVSLTVPIQQFEVRGPTLEEIFMGIVENVE